MMLEVGLLEAGLLVGWWGGGVVFEGAARFLGGWGWRGGGKRKGGMRKERGEGCFWCWGTGKGRLWGFLMWIGWFEGGGMGWIRGGEGGFSWMQVLIELARSFGKD